MTARCDDDATRQGPGGRRPKASREGTRGKFGWSSAARYGDLAVARRFDRARWGAV